MVLHLALIPLIGLSVVSHATDVLDTYPNPRQDWPDCKRTKPSYICNPDNVLNNDDAERLDILAYRLRRSTICLCSKCNSQHLGASFGIFIKYNHTVNELNGTDLGVLARKIRQQWQLGWCDDDIIVVVIAQTKNAAIDIGWAIENAISRDVGQRIFRECAIHFENGYFYQGLESMIYSFDDVLRRFQRPRRKPPPSQLTLILGASLGVVVLFILLVALIVFRCRQISKRRKRSFRSLQLKQEPVKRKKEFEYKLCSADEISKDESDSDEGIDSDDEGKIFETSTLEVPQFFGTRTKRQLSDVAEENEEELDSIRHSITGSLRSHRAQSTEL